MRRLSCWWLIVVLGWMTACAPEPDPKSRSKTERKAAKTTLKEPLVGVEIGQQAPEIEGQDIDGKTFKLSDYRGKVVFLDFWGHWCGPCRGMYPHERSLVKDNEGKPFALLGVNSGDSEILLEKLKKEGELTWRFWLDKEGEIIKAWDIEAFPTIYLLDQRGVVRFKFEGAQGAVIDRALKQLLAEVANDGKAASSAN